MQIAFANYANNCVQSSQSVRLLRLRGQREDRSVPVCAAGYGCAVERATYIDQACRGLHAIACRAKAMQHFLLAVRRDAKDRPAATASGASIWAAIWRRAIEGAFYVDQGCGGTSAIGCSAAEAVEHPFRAARRDAKNRSANRDAITTACATDYRRAVERALYLD